MSDSGGKKVGGVEVDPVEAVLYSGTGDRNHRYSKTRTKMGALKRAVSKSLLLRGPSTISKEAKERFP